MADNSGRIPIKLNRLELIAVGFIIAVSLTIGWARVDHRMSKAYASFLELAPQVEKALERFAQDHDGHFPPPVDPGRRPPGLDDSYLEWDPMWGLAYDARKNGRKDLKPGEGDCYVCLEFMPPPTRRAFHRLCRYPLLRQRYGRGQPIPGEGNRIWLVREKARIMPLPRQSPPEAK